MTQKEAIKTLLAERKMTQGKLSEELGYAHQSGISMMFQRGEVTVKTLLRICDIFGYELTIQPKRRAGARPAGQIVIDS